MKITVLYYPDDITMMFSLYPLLKSKCSKLFDFTFDPEEVWRLKNRAIVLFKFWKYAKEAGGRPYLQRIRDTHEKVAYFDDLADPRQVMTDHLDLVDLYFKKSLLVDSSLYKKEFYGHRVFADYYHKKYGIMDEQPGMARHLSEREIAKLRLAWNIGIGSYPKTRARKAICMRLGGRGGVRLMSRFLADPLAYRSTPKKVSKVSAHFRMPADQRTVVFQRELFLKEASSRPDLFQTGRVPIKEYNREMRLAAATLSPFGWGEVCFRDFEAVINRSVLLKPSMDHVDTWPNVYRRGETYLPLDWDAKDLVAVAENCLRDPDARARIAEGAYDVYREGISSLEGRVDRFVGQIMGSAG